MRCAVSMLRALVWNFGKRMPADFEQRLQQLEQAARALEPDQRTRRELMEQAYAYADRFTEQLDDAPTYVPPTSDFAQVRAPIDEGPVGFDSLLSAIESQVAGQGMNLASGGDLGYIPGGGLYPSALGDFLAAINNSYCGVAFASPGAAAMERALTDWMCQLMGYPDGAIGDLTSGGSMANLTGLVTAREHAGLRAAQIPRATVYMTGQVHHCVDKTLKLIGLGECTVRRVPMDARYRMDAEALAAMIKRDKLAGYRPWVVVASAGTTDTGAIDPLEHVAEIARKHRLWLHVDAAYGGFFAMTDEGAERLTGIGAADSIVMDPHKGLFLPYGTGAILIRDRRHAQRAHTYRPSYMQDAITEAISPADISPELSRHFRGLRAWLPLKLAGLSAFRAALEEKLLLARYFHEHISQAPGFEAGPYPDLSVVTYRYRPAQGDANAFNAALVDAVQKEGKVFISSTTIDGQFVLRAAILAVRTHRDWVDAALDRLQFHAARLAQT